MSAIKYERSDVIEGVCTAKEYYDQFDTARALEVGEVYQDCTAGWMQTKYKVVYIGHGVALGVEYHNGREGSKWGAGHAPSRALFHSEGMCAGWKVDENRAAYRLQELKA